MKAEYLRIEAMSQGEKTLVRCLSVSERKEAVLAMAKKKLKEMNVPMGVDSLWEANKRNRTVTLDVYAHDFE